MIGVEQEQVRTRSSTGCSRPRRSHLRGRLLSSPTRAGGYFGQLTWSELDPNLIARGRLDHAQRVRLTPISPIQSGPKRQSAPSGSATTFLVSRSVHFLWQSSSFSLRAHATNPVLESFPQQGYRMSERARVWGAPEREGFSRPPHPSRSLAHARDDIGTSQDPLQTEVRSRSPEGLTTRSESPRARRPR